MGPVTVTQEVRGLVAGGSLVPADIGSALPVLPFGEPALCLQT